MRISDWSSDVCSSDLRVMRQQVLTIDIGPLAQGAGVVVEPDAGCLVIVDQPGFAPRALAEPDRRGIADAEIPGGMDRQGRLPRHRTDLPLPLRRRQQLAVIGAHDRSEEHTSELQSLMRISYAVFCLKKKKQQNYHSRHTTYH